MKDRFGREIAEIANNTYVVNGLRVEAESILAAKYTFDGMAPPDWIEIIDEPDEEAANGSQESR